MIPEIQVGVYDWTDCETDEFIAGYIKPQGLRHSAGSAFHAADNMITCVYALDRTGYRGYADKEIDILSVIQPHLDNLHRNLFVRPPRCLRDRDPQVQHLLTKRESEIADLLCRGLTPNKIGDHLCLSVSTVYRHIANMHTKLNVSNRQELLLMLMNNSRRLGES